MRGGGVITAFRGLILNNVSRALNTLPENGRKILKLTLVFFKWNVRITTVLIKAVRGKE